AYAKEANSVPLITVEFPAAALEYPIVFAGEDVAMPVAALGIRHGQNLYVNDDGTWEAKYVPVFMRQYPFVFAKADGENQFGLCIDEDFSGCGQDGVGERLFDTEGEQTQFLKSRMDFLTKQQVELHRTRRFGEEIGELNLLDPMAVEFTSKEGEKLRLVGFKLINRERLADLPADRLAELVKSGALELIYLHLASLHHIRRLADGFAASGEEPDKAAVVAGDG
ncbi:MAG: SapC family protein, partial [Phycisphaerae bacterium]|nr:SapC family protein [Phycisphaerae bacterium]